MPTTAATRSMMLLRALGWSGVILIVVLAVIPGDRRPAVMADGHHEHFAAYFIASSLLAIAHSRLTQVLSSAIMLIICAGALEIVQSWIPGRTASVWDFGASILGACTGLALIALVRSARGGMATRPLPK